MRPRLRARPGPAGAKTGAIRVSSEITRSFPVSWDQLHRDSRALAWRLSGKGDWRGVIAVTRGGLVPAAIVSRELDIRLVDTVCVSSYDHQDQGTVTILKRVSGDGEGMLMVDDLVDTGATMRTLRAMLPKAHVATVYAKPDGQPQVDTYITEVSQDTWIHFPWDLELQYAVPIAETRPGGGR